MALNMGLSKRLQDEVEEFCSSASTHGFGYFFRFSLVERLFWIVITITMLVLGAFLINQMRVDWEDNPTLVRADTSRHPIDSIPVPAITICNNFTPDKWGFLRRLLNQVKFQCNSDQECQETLDIRDFFKTSFLESYARWQNASLSYFLYQFTNLTQSLIESNLAEAKAGDDALKSFELDLESVEMMNYLHHLGMMTRSPYHQSPGLDMITAKVLGLLSQKLQGRRNNYGLQRDLQVSPFSSHKIENSDFAYLEDIGIKVLLAITLSLPVPGQFGSFYFNYAQDMEDDVVNTRLKAWNNPANNRRTYNQVEMHLLYEDIFNRFFGSRANVSIADIAPILTPAKNYIDDRRYSIMFRHTVFTQASQTQYLGGSQYSYLDQIPKFLLKKNYFGQLFSSNLAQVMEIMYHSTLRAGSFRDEWMKESKLYPGGVQRLVPFPLINSTLFYPKVEDYQRETLSYSPSLVFGSGYRQFLLRSPAPDDLPDISFKFDQKTPIDITHPLARSEANQVLEDLRQKYQHQQMVLFCQDNVGTNCEALFRPVPTDKGLCYAINTPTMNDVMKASAYMDLFTTIFADQVKSETTSQNLTTGYTIHLILDSHQSSIFDYEPGTFWIGINQQLDFMAVKEHGIQAQPGMHTHIQITPEIIETTDRFKDPAIQTRQCRFIDEVDDQVSSDFKNYTFKSCDFECKLRHSRSKCGCTPWNYPHSDDVVAEMCDGVQAYCFNKAMGEDYDKEECSCLQDCHEFIYTTSSYQHKIDPNNECDLRPNWKSMVFDVPFGAKDFKSTPIRHMGTRESSHDLPILIGEKLRHLDGAEQKFWLLKLMSTRDFVKAGRELYGVNRYLRYVAPEVVGDTCVDMVTSDLAFVTISVPGSLASKVVRDLRFSFTDKISAIGGTVGLFTGMSLLSLVEALFWISRMIALPLRPQ